MVKCNIDIDTCNSAVSKTDAVVITLRTPRKKKLIKTKEFYDKHHFLQKQIANGESFENLTPDWRRFRPNKDHNTVDHFSSIKHKNQPRLIEIPGTIQSVSKLPKSTISFDSSIFSDIGHNTSIPILKNAKAIVKDKSVIESKQITADTYELLTENYKVSMKKGSAKRELKKPRFPYKVPRKKLVYGTFHVKNADSVIPIGLKMAKLCSPDHSANKNISINKPKEQTMPGYEIPDYIPEYFNQEQVLKSKTSNKRDTNKILEDENNFPNKSLNKGQIENNNPKLLSGIQAKKGQTLMKSKVKKKNRLLPGDIQAIKGQRLIQCEIENKIPILSTVSDEVKTTIKYKIGAKKRKPTSDRQVKKERTSSKSEIRKKKGLVTTDAQSKKGKTIGKSEMKKKKGMLPTDSKATIGAQAKRAKISNKSKVKKEEGMPTRDALTKKEQTSSEGEIEEIIIVDPFVEDQTSGKVKIGAEKRELTVTDEQTNKERVSEEKQELLVEIEVEKKHISIKFETDKEIQGPSHDVEVENKKIVSKCEEEKTNLPDNTDNSQSIEVQPLNEQELCNLSINENSNKLGVSNASVVFSNLNKKIDTIVESIGFLSSEVQTTNVRLDTVLSELQNNYSAEQNVKETVINQTTTLTDESEFGIHNFATIFEEIWQEVFPEDTFSDKHKKETINKHASLEKSINCVLTENPTVNKHDDKIVEKNLSKEGTVEQPTSTTNDLFNNKDTEKDDESSGIAEAIQKSNASGTEITESQLTHQLNNSAYNKETINEKNIKLRDSITGADSDSIVVEEVYSPLALELKNTSKKTNIKKIFKLKETTSSSSTLHESSCNESEILQPTNIVRLKNLYANDETNTNKIFTVDNTNITASERLRLEEVSSNLESSDSYTPRKYSVLQKRGSLLKVKSCISPRRNKICTDKRKNEAQNLKVKNASHKLNQKFTENERTIASISRLEHVINSMVDTVKEYLRFLQGAPSRKKQNKLETTSSSITSDKLINTKKQKHQASLNLLETSVCVSYGRKNNTSTESSNLTASSDDCSIKNKHQNKNYLNCSETSNDYDAPKKKKIRDDNSSFSFTTTSSANANANIDKIPKAITTTRTPVSYFTPKVDNSISTTDESDISIPPNTFLKPKVNFIKGNMVKHMPCTCIVQKRLVYPSSSSDSDIEIPSHKSDKEAENLKKYFEHADELQATSDTSEMVLNQREEAGQCSKDVQTTFSHIYSNLKETCLYCMKGYLPVYDEGILRVIYEFIKEYDPKDIGLIINVAKNNLFHIKIILMSSGRAINCFYSTIKGLQDARQMNIMQHFPMYFT